MPGKPITISQSEYEILSQAKKGYEQSKGESADWGRFLLFLLGLYIMNEVTKPEKKYK
ncbi:hypothetical protein ACFLWX_03510 [Chloroflexota bacterium]